MQLSNLKKISIQNSLSKNINLRKISEIQFQIIELYKSKYRTEINEEVGKISLVFERNIFSRKNRDSCGIIGVSFEIIVFPYSISFSWFI